MQFLSPWSALFAAAIAVPLLLLLYFLKLRRQTLRIPSTLLWRETFEDLQVNAPFQRLRWSLLLALQLLMLLTLLLALAEPLWRGRGGAASRVVLMIDCSASMNAPVIGEETNDKSMSRLDAAKRAAIEIIDTLGSSGRSGPQQIMLISFGASAQVISTFETNRGVLRDAVNAIAPTDEEADLEAALDLAAAFAGTRDEAVDADAPPEVVMLSDGNVAGADDRQSFALRAGKFRFLQVAGAPTQIDNLGIVALGVRREYDDPARVLLFARLLNAAPQAIDAIFTVALDGQPAASIRKSIPGATGDGGPPGETTLSHALDLPGGAVITLRHNLADQLAADDIAAVVLPPPSRPRIAIVFPAGSAPDPYLHELLQAMEPERLDAVTADAWAQFDTQQIDSGSRFDLVVFDRVSGARLPGIPSMTFGGVPSGIQAREAGDDRGKPILSWDRQHPIMRNLALDSIAYSGFGGFDLPESLATPLAFGPDGPIIALLRTRGARHVVVGFAPGKSNWPLHVSSAMFIQNAVEFLTLSGSGGGGGGDGLVHRPGEAISVRAAPDVDAIMLEGVDESRGNIAAKVEIPVAPGSPVVLPVLRRAGLYRAQGAMPPNNVIAVSMLSDVESNIRPRDSINVNAQVSEARSAKDDQPFPLWPWLLAAALVLAVLEWLAYCRRVR